MPDPVFAHTEQKDREVQNVSYDFSGQVVLISGAAHGQGRTHAIAFAKAGANLALCDLGHNIEGIFYSMGTESELEATAEECRSHGAEVLTQICDVRDDAETQAFVDDTVKELGKIDVAVANAGVAGIVELIDMTKEEWDAVVDTNLTGVFLTLKHVARKMVDAGGGGSLVATGSVHCFTGVPGSGHYVAAKHGVAGLCKSLAIELAPHKIRVNYVCPTAANTHMVEAVSGPARSRGPRRAAVRHHRQLEHARRGIAPDRAHRDHAGGDVARVRRVPVRDGRPAGRRRRLPDQVDGVKHWSKD